MECAAARKWLFREIDGELLDPESEELNTHLSQCVSCAREYKLLALPRRIARVVPAFSPSSYFYQKLRMRIEGEAQSVAVWQVFIRMAHQVVPALAGITLALLTVFTYLHLRNPEIDIYRAYGRVFISEDQPHRMFIAEQAEITDVSVLNAIAERLANHRDNPNPK